MNDMVKKKNNKVNIDYEKCILEDRLLQIKDQAYTNELQLVEVWTIDINPKQSAKVLVIVRELSLLDHIPLTHIKRIQPIGNLLRVVLCTSRSFEENDLILKLTDEDFTYTNLRLQNVPTHCPGTKELAQDWGRAHWPLVWKGNPNDQILNEVKIDIRSVQNHLCYIHTLSTDITKAGLPIVTSIVNPENNEILAITRDLRHIHPLKHSIMDCVEKVSQKEQQRRGESSDIQHYLCNDYHVYTTHEPCSMCAMALIHSRVSRLIYLRPVPSTGSLKPSSAEGYTIHNHKYLNSKFEAWEWIGDDYIVSPLDPGINA